MDHRIVSSKRRLVPWLFFLPGLLLLTGAETCPGAEDMDDDGYSVEEGDCDDANPAVHPDATETCNEVDDNCDGDVDTGVGATWYLDADGDGYGLDDQPLIACAQPAGYAADAGDCDDAEPSIHPGATETCNEVDRSSGP